MSFKCVRKNLGSMAYRNAIPEAWELFIIRVFMPVTFRVVSDRPKEI